jgi:hypothetical protein
VRWVRRIGLGSIVAFLLAWLLSTFWVQYAGDAVIVRLGDQGAPRRALIVYNPDPIYNLDEQVTRSFAEGLLENDIASEIRTVQATPATESERFDLLVLCTNTYNWAPDWLMSQYAEDSPTLEGRPVVAIILGSGTTSRSQRMFEESIRRRGAQLLDSRSLWLLRPNDRSRSRSENVEVARERARAWGAEIARQLDDERPMGSAGDAPRRRASP